MDKKALCYTQTGGPTPTSNVSFASIARAFWRCRADFSALYVAVGGQRGLTFDDIVRIDDRLEEKDGGLCFSGTPLSEIEKSPLFITRTSRFKARGEEDLAKMVDNLTRKDIGCLIYRGGNDGAQKALEASEYISGKGAGFLVAHLPKTIDNDLLMIDICPGFPSAAKSAILDTLALIGDTFAFGVAPQPAKTLPAGIEKEAIFTGIVVQGRDAGWLAASTVLAGPDLIYVAEVPISIDGFVNDVQKVFDRKGTCTAVFSEGIRLKGGGYLASYAQVGAPLLNLSVKELTREDAHKNKSVSDCRLPLLLKRIVEERVAPPSWAKSIKGRTGALGYKTRMDVTAISAGDVRLEQELADKILDEFLRGNTAFMATVERESDEPFRYRITTAASNKVADTSKESRKMTRPLPVSEFLTPEKNNVRLEVMQKYLAPYIDLPGFLYPFSSRAIAYST